MNYIPVGWSFSSRRRLILLTLILFLVFLVFLPWLLFVYRDWLITPDPLYGYGAGTN